MKKILLIIISMISLNWNTLGKGENVQAGDAESRLNAYEKIMERYFRGDPRETLLESMNRQINEYNNWFSPRKKILESERGKLNEEFKSVDEIKKQIDTLDEKLTRIPDPTDEKAVKAYNEELKKRNALVEKYNGLAKAYKEHETAFNTSVKKFESEIASRKDALESQKKEAMDEVQVIDQWFNEKNDQAFFADLNQTYAQLIEEKQRTGNEALDASISKVRGLRHELGQCALSKQHKAENGLIVVPALLGSSTESFFIVDTGASLVTITPELVRVLGLEEKVGKEIKTDRKSVV